LATDAPVTARGGEGGAADGPGPHGRGGGLAQTLRLVRLVTASAAIALGLVLVIGLAREANEALRGLRTAGLDNVQWTATQLEVDVLRLVLVADDALMGGSLDELRVRYDILYSRAGILERGAIYQEVGHDAAVSAGLASLRAFLDDHLAAIDGSDAVLEAALPVLRAEAVALHAELRETVLRVLEHFARTADEERLGLTALLERIALVTAALLALLLALVLLLARLSARQTRAQAELRIARDAALAGERAKASFVAVMSHEMRTPLNGIIASLEILRDEVTAPGHAQFLGLAHASALQLMHQINDVLDISRIEAGRAEITAAPFDLPAFLRELAATLGPLAGARGNRLELRLDPDLPVHVAGDGFRLRQILQNFLSNAIKFTEHGTVTLGARTVAVPTGSVPEVEFEVIDSGRGIRPEDLGRVFEDFVMLDPTYSREVGGSGLGLSICRRLATAMGGTIGAESAPGTGSRFWVRLPLAPVAEPVPVRQGAAEVTGATPRATSRPGLRLLVVDDNAVNRTVVARMLEQEGHAAVLADSGRAAVALARAQRFDAILMDISMPEVDGVTAAGLIRAGGASSAVPIFALTAHAMPEELARFAAAGLETTLLKPVRRPVLRAALAGIEAEGPPVLRSRATG
jgi:signal transduction histidine kinase